MSDPADDFAGLLARARQGDTTALTELVRQYESEIRTVARDHLGLALRPFLDSMDVVQSVYQSLLVALQAGKFRLQSPQDLVALTVTMVRRKVAQHWRRVRRQQRSSLDSEATQTVPAVLVALTCTDDDPARAAEYEDALRHVWKGLNDTERQVVELHLAGYRTAEVARRLGLDGDVLRAQLSRLRRRLRDHGTLADWL